MQDSYIFVEFKCVSLKLSYLFQTMLSNRTVEENDGSNPCIEISDIKYETFTVGYVKDSFHRRIPSIPKLHIHPAHN